MLRYSHFKNFKQSLQNITKQIFSNHTMVNLSNWKAKNPVSLQNTHIYHQSFPFSRSTLEGMSTSPFKYFCKNEAFNWRTKKASFHTGYGLWYQIIILFLLENCINFSCTQKTIFNIATFIISLIRLLCNFLSFANQKWWSNINK